MRNDSLNDLSLKPTRDELAQRQRPRASRTASGGNAAPVVVANTAPLWSLVILLLIVMGGGGWYLWVQIQSLQSSLDQSRSALNQSEQTLTSLQQNIDIRTKTQTKSGDQMAAELKELDSEVRKLWDLANKRQKAELEQHGKALAALEANLKTRDAALDKQAQTAADNTKKLREEWQQLKDAQAAVQTALDSQKTALENQKAALERQKAALETQQASLKKQDAELARLRSSAATPDDLETRITNLEVSSKSLDAYRRQVNGRLDQLDQQVRQIYK